MKTKVNEIQRQRNTGREREGDRDREKQEERIGLGSQLERRGEEKGGRRGRVEGSNLKWLKVFKTGKKW